MKTLTKMAAWVGAAALVAVPSAHAAPVHATDNLKPASKVEVSSEETSDAVTPYIVGGSDADIKDWPWMMHLVIKEGKDVGYCAGFIISRNVALTAGHCLEDSDQDTSVTAYYGSALREGPKAKTAVLESEDWETSGGGRNGDWAVLKFKHDLDIHPSQHLPISQRGAFDKNPTFELAGWGRTSDGGPFAEILQEVTLDFIPDEICQEGASIICSGKLPEGGKSGCGGDSGAPLIYRSGPYAVAVGIHVASGCGEPGVSSDATKVSFFYDAIMEKIDELGGARPNPAPAP